MNLSSTALQFFLASYYLATNVQGQSTVWTELGTVDNPGNVVAASPNTYSDNVLFAFGSGGGAVTTAFTGWGGTVTTGTISAAQSGAGFGASLSAHGDANRGGDILVGAPGYVSNETTTGAVFSYSFDVIEGGGSGTIEQRGGAIIGSGYDRGTPGNGFAKAVAFMGSNQQAVVCAPEDNTLRYATSHGRCFVYSYTPTNDPSVWEWIQHPDSGTAYNDYVGDEGDNFGAAVAGDCCIPDNDDLDYYFVAGNPKADGGVGRVHVVAHNSEDGVFEGYTGFIGGNSSPEACGTSVAASGPIVAFGCPGAGSQSNGRVRVVTLEGNQELGDGILGADGDRLGLENSITISHYCSDVFGEDEISGAVGITVTTAGGKVKQFVFLNDEWVEMSDPFQNSGSTAIGAGTFLCNIESYVAVSAPNGSGSSRILSLTYETMAPTPAPVEASTPSPVEEGTAPPVAAPTPGVTSAPSEDPDESSAPDCLRSLTYLATFSSLANLFLAVV